MSQGDPKTLDEAVNIALRLESIHLAENQNNAKINMAEMVRNHGNDRETLVYTWRAPKEKMSQYQLGQRCTLINKHAFWMKMNSLVMDNSNPKRKPMFSAINVVNMVTSRENVDQVHRIREAPAGRALGTHRNHRNRQDSQCKVPQHNICQLSSKWILRENFG